MVALPTPARLAMASTVVPAKPFSASSERAASHHGGVDPGVTRTPEPTIVTGCGAAHAASSMASGTRSTAGSSTSGSATAASFERDGRNT